MQPLKWFSLTQLSKENLYLGNISLMFSPVVLPDHDRMLCSVGLDIQSKPNIS